jgi:uncharacterized protein (TIGR00369 family)
MKTSTDYARISRLARMMTAGELLPIEGRNVSEGGVEALNPEQLERLASYFDEEVTFSKHVGARVEKVEPGRVAVYIDVEKIHLNGNGTLHGGVYTSLIDNAMGLSVSSLVGLRTATTQMNVHFLGPVREGRIICRSEVVHRTRRTATAEGRVFDGEGNLVAMGTGSFRIFEKQGNPIV